MSAQQTVASPTFIHQNKLTQELAQYLHIDGFVGSLQRMLSASIKSSNSKSTSERVERQMEFNMCMTAAPDLNHDILIYPITSAVCYLALLLTISKKCVDLIIKTLLDSSVH
mgnify:FL=1